MAIETPIPRAVFAADPGASRGRRVDEPPSPSRNDFRRDCDRIIHSAAFREGPGIVRIDRNATLSD